jgi:hypothetical protein
VSRVREIRGFDGCESLPEIKIPASVEILRGLNRCLKLKTIRFAPNSRLRVINGFRDYFIGSIELPGSVERLSGFDDGSSSSQMVNPDDNIMKIIVLERNFMQIDIHPPRVFIVYREEDLKKRRCRLNVMKEEEINNEK